MRRADPHQSVADSLQADVMRFMAIIAFCLIAILALVRSVAPVEPADEPAPASPAVPSVPQPIPDRRPVADPPVASPPLAQTVAPTSTPTPTPTPAEEEGLSLRFASEQDFLRLVTRGRIQVFAFNGEEVLTIGADLTARPAPAPGEVHELLPETIPELMTGALARRHGQGYRWAVAMPDGMARQIRRFVDQGATGELIIDRFGEVRHRDA